MNENMTGRKRKGNIRTKDQNEHMAQSVEDHGWVGK